MPLDLLVIENEKWLRSSYARVLRGHADVVGVASCAEAWRVLEREGPVDVVLLDVNNHQDDDAISWVARLRGSDVHRDTCVVATSGSPILRKDTEQTLASLGVHELLRKPFTLRDLLEAIQTGERTWTNLRLGSVDVRLLQVGIETESLDYKRTLDLSENSGAAGLAKDVIAMANSQGGDIVVGVGETTPGTFELVGLNDEEVAALETSRVNETLAPYLAGAVAVTCKPVEHDGKRFVLIKVPWSDDTVVFAARQHERARLFRGRIYVRTRDARSRELVDHIEATRLLERLVEARTRRRR